MKASDCGCIVIAIRENEFHRSSVSSWDRAIQPLSRVGRTPWVPNRAFTPATSTKTPSARAGLFRKLGLPFSSAACVRTPPIRPAALNVLAAMAPMAPTTKIASYVSTAVSSASVTMQPDDAPIRSTPYTRLIFCELRVNARLTATPSRTYGGSNTRRVSVHERTKPSVGSKVGMTARFNKTPKLPSTDQAKLDITRASAPDNRAG